MHLLRRAIGDIVEANVPQRRGEGDGRGHQQLPPLGEFWAGRRPRRTFGPLIFHLGQGKAEMRPLRPSSPQAVAVGSGGFFFAPPDQLRQQW